MRKRYDEYDKRSLLQDVTPVKDAPILGYNWKNFLTQLALIWLIYHFVVWIGVGDLVEYLITPVVNFVLGL